MRFDLTSLVVAAALFVLTVPLVLFVTLRAQRRPAMRFSSVVRARAAGRSLLWHMRHVPLALRLLALAFLLVGFARPRTPNASTRLFTEGVAIQMVVDRSSSMSQPMNYQGRRQSRFQVVQQVFRDFVLGDKKDLRGRPSDLIGLTSFTAFVADNCPLTLDHDNLVSFMNTMETSRGQEPGRGGIVYVDPDDGTAIGDAIQFATLRLVNAEQELEQAAKARPGYTIKSKIIILLTDGEDNASSITPVQAAQFAKENGIKVYTIAVVEPGGARRVDDPLFGSILIGGPQPDTRALEQVAAITGGVFGRATSGESLKQIYEKIDKLERSRFEEHVRDYNEHFAAWWAVPLGFGLLIVEVVARNTLFRRVP
ncbi:MAG: VWA domain-containing protein [Verrucomicrobia bacterium]|nr:VWA domain-containing protein [Verrucomicrobiota bacterium]